MSSEEKKYKFPADIQAKIDRKEKLTKAEVSIVRSINAKNGAERRKREGTCRGGRPRALPELKAEVRSLSIRQEDYREIQKWACMEDVTIVEQAHRIVEIYKKYMSGACVSRGKTKDELNQIRIEATKLWMNRKFLRQKNQDLSEAQSDRLEKLREELRPYIDNGTLSSNLNSIMED